MTKLTPVLSAFWDEKDSFTIDGEVWHLDVGSSQPGADVGPKGWAVRP